MQCFSLKRLAPDSVVVDKVTSSQRGFSVLQVGEVFMNGLKPNIMDCFVFLRLSVRFVSNVDSRRFF